MRTVLGLVITGTICIGATPALAESELGTRSSETISIEVDIPPLGAAFAAHQAGAAGLWTVTTSHNGLMVALPDRVNATGAASATIYSGSDTVFTATVDGNSGMRLATTQVANARGLLRQDFTLQRITNSAPQDTTPVSLTITGV